MSKCSDVPYIEELIEKDVGKHIDEMLNERLLSILSTKENVNLETLGFSEEMCIRDRRRAWRSPRSTVCWGWWTRNVR